MFKTVNVLFLGGWGAESIFSCGFNILQKLSDDEPKLFKAFSSINSPKKPGEALKTGCIRF